MEFVDDQTEQHLKGKEQKCEVTEYKLTSFEHSKIWVIPNAHLHKYYEIYISNRRYLTCFPTVDSISRSDNTLVINILDFACLISPDLCGTCVVD